jgi:hypothetical protein
MAWHLLILRMIVRADFVQMNGVAVLLWSLTYVVIARFRAATLPNVPRRIRRFVISAKKRSTALSQDELVGVK